MKPQKALNSLQKFKNNRSKEEKGITPHVGVDGFWYVGETNTGEWIAGERGVKGDKGEPGPVNLCKDFKEAVAGCVTDTKHVFTCFKRTVYHECT